MLTPKFSLSQSNDQLTLMIYATFARVTDTEISFQDNILKFYSSPYYLSLHLPGKLVDSEEEKHNVSFDVDSGAFTIKCMKLTPGEYFPGLDMLTDLLTPKGVSSVQEPLIEVLNNEVEAGGAYACPDEEEFEFVFEQKLPIEEEDSGFKYGFANSKSGVFTTLKSELQGIIDVPDPDNTSASQRRLDRIDCENKTFNENHYLADLFEGDVEEYLNFVPLFRKLNTSEVEMTSEEDDVLLQLPRKELLIDKGATTAIYIGLVDILFAWCYNHRITHGENCAESAWNIAKLSSAFSWLDSFQDLKSVLVASVRRSLIFPLCRNWQLALKVIDDTSHILTLGKKQVLKCLLEIRRIFDGYDPYYLHNQLYVTEYCLWIQRANDHKLNSLADSLRKIKLKKEIIGLELIGLEAAAKMVLEEQEPVLNKLEPVAEEREPVLKEREPVPADANPIALIEPLEQLSVIENKFALLRNDNDSSVEAEAKEINQNVRLVDDSDDSESSDDDSSESEDDSTDSSSSDSSILDSDDDTSPEDQ